jgi:hypothetical protein
VVGENGQLGEVGMTAELYGMFFVAEDVFASGDSAAGRPLELTCYRRNLWQCLGRVTLPRYVAQVLDDQGVPVPVFELVASIAAVESIEGKQTEIISIPWKSAHPALGQETKAAGPPPNIPLDLGTGHEVGANRVSFPVAWKRLQFKHATANNGRRKGLQQHYVVQITLLGKTATGEYMKIAEIRSGPVIVRGRSPRNFDTRRDVPLTGDKKTGEKRSLTNTDPGDVSTPERDVMSQGLQRYPSFDNIKQSPSEWGTPQPQPQPQHNHHQQPAKRKAVSPSIVRPPVPSWSKESSSSLNLNRSPSSTPLPSRTTSQQQVHTSVSSVPINLSLSEDEKSPDVSSPQFSKSTSAGFTSTPHTPIQNPAETADMLYEYFPLSLDDW